MELDNFCGFNEVKKKNIILPIGETLKYLENSYDNIVSPWNSKNMPIDIERQINTTMLDVLNYHTFMSGPKKTKIKKIVSNKNIKFIFMLFHAILVIICIYLDKWKYYRQRNLFK